MTATIGAQGGQLATADGRMKIIVPAGAVAVNQAFSIQPVTGVVNNSINATHSYKLMPEGAVFNKAVTVVMQYDPATIPVGSEDFLQVATQDASGAWKVLPTALNKTTRTLTVETVHFSVYEFFPPFELFSDKEEVAVGNKVGFKLGYQQAKDSALQAPDMAYITKDFNKDTASNYTAVTPLYASKIKGWRVVNSPGKIVGRNNGFGLDGEAEYTAPASVDWPTEVTVEVTIEGNWEIPDPSASTGKRILKLLIIQKTIKVIPDDIAFLYLNGNEYWLNDGLHATVANGQTSLGAGSNSILMLFTINVTATVPGVYSCGQFEPNSKKAFVTFSFGTANGNFVESNSTYCVSQNNQSVTRYSPGTLTIKKLGEVGDWIQGVWTGTLYEKIPNVEGCEFHEREVTIKFYIRRRQ